MEFHRAFTIHYAGILTCIDIFLFSFVSKHTHMKVKPSSKGFEDIEFPLSLFFFSRIIDFVNLIEVQNLIIFATLLFGALVRFKKLPQKRTQQTHPWLLEQVM